MQILGWSRGGGEGWGSSEVRIRVAMLETGTQQTPEAEFTVWTMDWMWEGRDNGLCHQRSGGQRGARGAHRTRNHLFTRCPSPSHGPSLLEDTLHSGRK